MERALQKLLPRLPIHNLRYCPQVFPSLANEARGTCNKRSPSLKTTVNIINNKPNFCFLDLRSMVRNFREVHRTNSVPERRFRHKRRHEPSRRTTSMLRGRQKYSLARVEWRTLQTIRARRSDSLTWNRTDRSGPSLNDLDLHLEGKSCGY